MEWVAQDVELGHFRVGYSDPGGIEIFVELTADGEPCGRGGRGNELHVGTIVDERLAPPVA